MSECDAEFGDDRSVLPLHRAARGKHMTMLVRFPVQVLSVELGSEGFLL